MKERAIILAPHEMRATLDGRQTMFRRMIVGSWPDTLDIKFDAPSREWYCNGGFWHRRCPFGQPGDRLWVRETWACIGHDPVSCHPPSSIHSLIAYKADDHNQPAPNSRRWVHGFAVQTGTPSGEIKWSPATTMPRWTSRLLLEITGVWAERLQDISEEDAEAEGVELEPSGFYRNYDFRDMPVEFARTSFRTLWDSTHGKKPGCSWAYNPWVWAINFKRMEAEK